VDKDDPWGVAPARASWRWKAPRHSAMLVSFARTSSQREPWRCAVVADVPGQRRGIRRRMGCSGIRESASALLRARWLAGDSARAWRLDGRSPWFRPWARTAHRGSVPVANPQRIASRRGACEVVVLAGCAPDSVLVAEAIEQHLAQRSHFGCGRGGGRGPSHSRETGVGERC
jgi:hypothetical protein